MFGALAAAAPFLSAAGSFIGGATSALGASQQLSARDAMDAQSQFNWAQHKKSLLQGPALEMQGLKAAGINPFYRYGQHGTPMSTTAAGVSQPPSVNRLQGLGDGISAMANSAVDAYGRIASAKQAEALTTKTIAELDQIAATVQNINQSTQLAEAQKDTQREQAQLLFAQRWETYARTDLLRAQRDGEWARIAELEQRVEFMRTHQGLMRSQEAINQYIALTAQAAALIEQNKLPASERDAWLADSWWGWATAAGGMGSNALLAPILGGGALAAGSSALRLLKGTKHGTTSLTGGSVGF